MKKYDTVCFDVDGTLYPPEVLNRYLSGLSLRHPRMCMLYSKLRKRFRDKQEGFEKSALAKADFSEREAAMLFEILKEKGKSKVKDIKQARSMLDTRYYEPLYRCFRTIKYQPDVVETFKYLKRHKIKTGVFSDWPLCDKLASIGVKDYIDIALSANDTGYLKPSLRCFESLLGKMGSEPKSTLYVGDSYLKDAEGAYNAGIDVVLVNCKGAESPDAPEKYPKALKVFQTWKDFDKWLKELQ